jgi:hypothetical protein
MNQPIAMPIDVFVQAVNLANADSVGTLQQAIAVQHVTDWWNATAAEELRCAFGFGLYVRHGDDWLSGTPEEGLVTQATWKRCSKPRAEATLLDGKVSFVFFKESVDENQTSFDAKAVDGGEGYSGGMWPGLTGNEIVMQGSYEVLELVPVRFPEIWQQACAQAEQQ